MQLNLQNPARGQSTTRQGCREEGGGGGIALGPLLKLSGSLNWSEHFSN
jgi:hypothetical protein